MEEGGPVTYGERLMESLGEILKEKEAEIDEEMARLDAIKDDEDELERIRAERRDSMMKKHKEDQENRARGHGSYVEITDEREFFEAAKKSKRVICHFSRPATWRCDIVDKHLHILAKKHVETRMIKINAEKAPYLCEKLRIMMLPTIVLIKDGKTDHSIIGFDEFGGHDEFSTEDMREILCQWDIINRPR